MKCELKEFIAHKHCIHIVEVDNEWSVKLTQYQNHYRVSIFIRADRGNIEMAATIHGNGDMSIDCDAAVNLMLVAIKGFGSFSRLLEDRIGQLKEPTP